MGGVRIRPVRTRSRWQMMTLETTAGRSNFRKRLLAWYDRNRRDLPWRRTRDPYRVWLSEIMLQQTRVTAVLGHYARFLELFPTVEELAAAREASVLAAWSGLGYYRRAGMLHRAATKIVQEMGGRFPATAEEWRGLPGIGRYSAAAIASIAFGEAAAVVDGNVRRVLQRLTGRELGGKKMWAKAQQLLALSRAGDFNQAMMELGAVVCLPGEPLCGACPVAQFCHTRGRGIRGERKARQHKRDIHYALHCRNGSVLLVRRPMNASLMPGMWELPEIAADGATPEIRLRHSITTTNYQVHVSRRDAVAAGGRWIAKSRLGTLPLTGLARKILRAAEIV